MSRAGDRAGAAGATAGRSPVDRGRTGSTHHLIADATGVPLAAALTGGIGESVGESDRCRKILLDPDVTSDDVLLLMGGVAYSVQYGTRAQARRLVDLLMDALTTGATAR